LVKYEEYQKFLLFLEKLQEDLITKTMISNSDSTHEITMDFILNNEIDFSFEKDEFINDYLNDFFPDEHHENDSIVEEPLEDDEEHQESFENLTKKTLDNVLLSYDSDDDKKHPKPDTIIDYDFIIMNCENNFKKIIKHIDLIKNDIVSEGPTIFKLKPLTYKPLLCEFLNGDGSIIKIDFCDNNKSYNFLVVDNCFDKTFLIYFMKKYYEVDVKENYILKVLDNDINTFLFDSSDILKLDENSICKLNK
jgi:hypothetical protein